LAVRHFFSLNRSRSIPDLTNYFPVSLRREYVSKPLSLLTDGTRDSGPLVEILEIPCIFR